MQRRLLPLGNRLAEMLFRQRFERRQRFVRLRAVSDQANGVAVAHLQQRQLIEAARIDALPLFFQHQLGLERRQRLYQPRRRARMQPVRVLHRPGCTFALRQRQSRALAVDVASPSCACLACSAPCASATTCFSEAPELAATTAASVLRPAAPHTAALWRPRLGPADRARFPR